MKSEAFSTYTMQYYAKWNKALFDYFFPQRKEDPLLFVDDALLNDIGSRNFSEEDKEDNSWTEFFLLYVLFNEDQIKDFKKEFHIVDGRVASTWNSIVTYLLLEEPQIDNIPSYFAIICAIMYVAQKEGADHSKMKSFAKGYLEIDNLIFAERVDDLFTQLNKDCPSFNHKRMVSLRTLSTKVNISRIKYHLVLKKKERDDFIDFIEVNNLKWEDGTYKDFADSYLLPSLAEAGKKNIIDKVKTEENNPYFKNLLTLPNLQFGKPASLENTRQVRTVYWRYELKFDFNTGDPVFIMTTGDALGGITFNGKVFKHNPNTSDISDPLGNNVSLQTIGVFDYIINGNHYSLKNIASSKNFYFESASHDYFHQVAEVIPGKHYLQFVPQKKRGQNACPEGWNTVTDFFVSGFDIYETQCYLGKEMSVDIKKDKVTDRFGFYRIGSYCRISLQEDEQLWWEPNLVGSALEKIETFSGADGYTYFRLNTNERTHCVSGSVSIKSRDDKYVLPIDSVHFEPRWNIASQKYHIDGWGNTVLNSLPTSNTAAGNATASKQLSYTKTDHTDILLNLLCELADENGCVNEIGMKNALNFVLQFHGIIDPNDHNRRKLIYALRRLEYVIGDKDPSTGKYVNQLVAPFVEKTLYRLTPVSANLYLIKGVYSDKELEDFKSQNNIRVLRYKRPYEKRLGDLRTPGYCAEIDSPEYKCLPDLVLFEGLQKIKKWNCIQSPYAYTLLSNIGDMKQFESRFLKGTGDVYYGNHGELPEMIDDDYHKEVLCFKDQFGQIRTSKYYCDSGSQMYLPIPKHLARVYCENEKNNPVFIINQGLSTDVSFLHKMGIPRVLDIALCDLNLGLPDEHKVFVIDHQETKLPIKISAKGESIPYSDIKTYHNINSKDWVKRLSSNNISPQYTPYSNSFTTSNWKMYLDKHRIIITHKDAICAFSEYGKVYIFDNNTQTYVRVKEEKSVNELLSEMLKSYSNIQNWKIEKAPVTPPTTVKGLIQMDII